MIWQPRCLDRAPEVKLGPAVNAMERRAQREAVAEGRDYVPVTVRGAAVYSARKARALVAELRERVEELRAAYALAREQGEGRIPAGLAALRALRAKGAAAEVEAGQVAGLRDIKTRLAGILQRDGEGKAVGQPSVPEPTIEARLPEVLGGRAVEEAVAAVARRNPRLISALAQIAERVASREQIGFRSPVQARAFFEDLRESYGGAVLSQVAGGDDRALVVDFPDAALRRQVAIGMVVLGRSYGEIEREGVREVGPDITREQEGGWEL